MTLVITAAERTDRGRARRRNEDAVRMDDRGIVVVADGMGGHPAGDVASALAAEEALRRLRSAREAMSEGRLSPAALEAVMAEAVLHADTRVREAWRQDPTLQGMGTTLTALLVERRTGRAVVGHVGDSRAYRLRSGSLELLTRDHTWVREEVEAGRLTPELARAHPRANMLTQAIGVDPPVEPDVTHTEARAGDTFLLCSDGLTRMLPDARVQELLAESLPGGLEAAAEVLVAAANDAGGLDNITVALLTAEEEGR